MEHKLNTTFLAEKIYNYFYKQDEPPVDQLIVNGKSIQVDRYDPTLVNVVLTYISFTPTKKVHHVKKQIELSSLVEPFQSLKFQDV